MPSVQNPSDKRRQSVNVTGNKTLAASDSGYVQNVIVDGATITLPASATAAVRAGGVPAGGPVGSGGNKSQTIVVTGTTAGYGAASGAATFTLAKASQQVGDEIEFVNGVVVRVVGNWVRS